jgi:hypothetical protein
MAQLGASGPPPASTSMSRRRLLTIVGCGVTGAVVIGGVAGTLIGRQNGDADAQELEAVPTAALPGVEATLAPDQAARLMEEARRCREPLARVTLWHSPGTPGGMVSIISGAYHSPRFALSATPSLVAIPYPAPYSSGKGVLSVVGEATDFAIALRPVIMKSDIRGTLLIHVWWTPVGGCP